MRSPLPSGVGGKNQHAVVVAERGAPIGDEPVAVEVGHNRRPQPVSGDELGKRWKLAGKDVEQLAERSCLQSHVSDTGALSRNAQKLNPHDDVSKIVA